MSKTSASVIENSPILDIDQAQELNLIKEALLKRDNSHAWEEFYNQYSRLIFSIANKILRDEDEAEDVVHEIMVKCLEQFGQYDQTQPFKPWLASVTKNFCINELKRKGSRPTHYIGAISADDCYQQDSEDSIYFSAVDTKNVSSMDNAISAENKNALDTILSRVKPEFKEVIELKYFEGLSYEEIARKINKPIGTVMSRLYNAKHKLKEEYVNTYGVEVNLD